MGLEMSQSQTVAASKFGQQRVLRTNLKRNLIDQINILSVPAQYAGQNQRDRSTNNYGLRLSNALAQLAQQLKNGLWARGFHNPLNDPRKPRRPQVFAGNVPKNVLPR